MFIEYEYKSLEGRLGKLLRTKVIAWQWLFVLYPNIAPQPKMSIGY